MLVDPVVVYITSLCSEVYEIIFKAPIQIQIKILIRRKYNLYRWDVHKYWKLYSV